MRGILIPGVTGIVTLLAAVTLMAFSAPAASAVHARHAVVTSINP